MRKYFIVFSASIAFRFLEYEMLIHVPISYVKLVNKFSRIVDPIVCQLYNGYLSVLCHGCQLLDNIREGSITFMASLNVNVYLFTKKNKNIGVHLDIKEKNILL